MIQLIKSICLALVICSFALSPAYAQDELTELEKLEQELAGLKADKKKREEEEQIRERKRQVNDSLYSKLYNLNEQFISYVSTNAYTQVESTIDSIKTIFAHPDFDECRSPEQYIINITDFYALQGKKNEFYQALSLLNDECSIFEKNYIKLTYFNSTSQIDSARMVVEDFNINLRETCFDSELTYNQKLECYADIKGGPQYLRALTLLNVSLYYKTIGEVQKAMDLGLAAHHVGSITVDANSNFAIDISLASLYFDQNELDMVYTLLNPYQYSVDQFLPRYQKEYYRLKSALAAAKGDDASQKEAQEKSMALAADMKDAMSMDEQIEKAYQNYEMDRMLSLVNPELAGRKTSMDRIIEQLENDGNFGVLYAKAIVLKAHALKSPMGMSFTSPKEYLAERLGRLNEDLAKIPVYEFLAEEAYQEFDTDAFEYYNTLLEIAERNNLIYLKLKATTGLAYLSDIFEMYDDAGNYYQESLLIAQQLIDDVFPYMTEEEQFIFNNKWILPLERSVFTFYSKLKDENKNEMSRALALFRIKIKGLLLESSAKTRLKVERSGDSTILNRYNQLVRKKEELSSKRGKISKEEEAALIAEIKEGEEFIQTRLGGSENKPQVTLNQIKNALGKNEVAVEVVRSNVATAEFLTDTINYHYIIIKQNEPVEIVTINDGKYLEDKAFDFYLNAIKYKVSDGQSYDTYWSFLESNLKGYKKIYTSMDGVYHGINVGGLFDSDNKEFLYEEQQIIQLSSLRELATEVKSDIDYNPSVFVGRPDFYVENEPGERVERGAIIQDLPGTEIEIEKISEKLQSRSIPFKKYLGHEATEENVKAVSSPRVLHIATHGFYDRNPNPTGMFDMPLLSSGLILSRAGDRQINDGNDGILSAYEISSLPLSNTELVVLSACESGVGEFKDGQGVYGISRAFLTAGAQSVISSLWKVDDDATQYFMSQFYENWLTSQNKYEAINYARSETRKKYEEPYYWAAFILTGMN